MGSIHQCQLPVVLNHIFDDIRSWWQVHHDCILNSRRGSTWWKADAKVIGKCQCRGMQGLGAMINILCSCIFELSPNIWHSTHLLYALRRLINTISIQTLWQMLSKCCPFFQTITISINSNLTVSPPIDQSHWISSRCPGCRGRTGRVNVPDFLSGNICSFWMQSSFRISLSQQCLRRDIFLQNNVSITFFLLFIMIFERIPPDKIYIRLKRNEIH